MKASYTELFAVYVEVMEVMDEEWHVAITGPMGGRRYGMEGFPWITPMRAMRKVFSSRAGARQLARTLKRQDRARTVVLVHVRTKVAVMPEPHDRKSVSSAEALTEQERRWAQRFERTEVRLVHSTPYDSGPHTPEEVDG